MSGSVAADVLALLPRAAGETPLERILAGRAYVRQRDLARAMAVDRATVRGWAKTGKLGFPPPVRLPVDGVFYPVPEVLEFERRFLALPRTVEAQKAMNAAHMEKRRLRKGARARDARREVDAIERAMVGL